MSETRLGSGTGGGSPTPPVELIQPAAVARVSGDRYTIVALSAGVRTKVCGANPRRFGLGFGTTSLSPNAAFLLPFPGVDPSYGWAVTLGNPLWFDLGSFGPVCQSEWYALASGSVSIMVIEAYRQP